MGGRPLLLVVLALTAVWQSLSDSAEDGNGVKSAVFLSPKIVLEPGSVANKYYYNVDFPRGHIAIKNFYAEVVDEAGNSIPLSETYLHHWVMMRYYYRKGAEDTIHHTNVGFQQSDFIVAGNSGICGSGLSQYFGLGSETRRTDTRVPDPYGIEVGNPLDVPPGYEERWVLNVHAIDTRGAEDKLGCTECRCDLYNVTQDEHGTPLQPNYVGGLYCCYDETRCKVKEGFQSASRSLFLKYVVTYVEWDTSIVPVRIYILDVTDTWKRLNDSTGDGSTHHCLVEYEVEPCSAGTGNDACIDTKKVSLSLPTGGNVIYGVGHQHTGGAGSTLYREDGRVICSSTPIYGSGDEPGNEAGYIVGMTSCHPQPGSVKISDGEALTLVSNYKADQRHTGVMGLFYLLIADSSPESNSVLLATFKVKNHEKVLVASAFFGMVLLCVAAVVMACYANERRNRREDGYFYKPMMT